MTVVLTVLVPITILTKPLIIANAFENAIQALKKTPMLYFDKQKTYC